MPDWPPDAEQVPPTLPTLRITPPRQPAQIAAPALPPVTAAAPSAPAMHAAPVLPGLQTSHSGPRGPQGEPGAAGSTDQIVYARVAGETLSGHRVVVVRDGKVYNADPTSLADASRPIRLSLNAALADETVQVLALGDHEEPSWSWTPGSALYAGAGGVLSASTPVGAAWVRVVAFAITATLIVFDPRDPIVLSP